jgi:hypothetical protein
MAAPDKNHLSICAEVIGERDLGTLTPPDATYADTLKITGGSHSGRITAARIDGGREDCIDINDRSHHIEINATALHSGGHYVATIKGGSHHITLRGKIGRPGATTDIDLGNWSDQSNDRTTAIRLDLTRADGSPVRVRLINADPPRLIGGGPYEIKRLNPLLWWCYKLLKHLRLC